MTVGSGRILEDRSVTLRRRTSQSRSGPLHQILRLDAPTELTTAATDVLLAAVCIACACYVRQRGGGALRMQPWRLGFMLFATGALLGAFAHALHIPPLLYRVVWAPIYLSLGLAVAFFLIGVVQDAAPARVPTLRPLILGLGVTSFLIAMLFPRAFFVFLAWQGVGLIVAIGVYTTLWTRGNLSGAGWITLGFLISMAAAAVQGTGTLSFTLIWPFDHNGAFHLIQLPGVAAIAYGLVQGGTSPTIRIQAP